MKILKAGTRVTTIIGNIDAIIVGVMITMETVEYKLRYFVNGAESTAWLFRYEIEVTTTKQPVGFGKKEIPTDESNLIEYKQQ